MPGRIWYEADINYIGGYKNFRILFFNDGAVYPPWQHIAGHYQNNEEVAAFDLLDEPAP